MIWILGVGCINMFGFSGVRRDNYSGRDLVKRTEVEVRVRKLKNEKAAAKDEVT